MSRFKTFAFFITIGLIVSNIKCIEKNDALTRVIQDNKETEITDKKKNESHAIRELSYYGPKELFNCYEQNNKIIFYYRNGRSIDFEFISDCV